MGASAGLIPCPSALVVLLGAISQHEVGLGLLLILVFSLGLAGTLTDVLGNSMGSNLTWSFTLPRPSTQTPVGVGAAWVAVIVLLAAIVVSLLVLLLRRRRQGGVATINPEPPRP